MSALFDKKLILVCGKGGVGRSTVAAAIAHQCAARGRNTLLFETNANDRFGDYFGRPAVGAQVVPLAPRLSAVNATPASALQEYGLMILKFQTAYDMVFENRVTKGFLRAIPGLDDYALLGKAWFHTTEQTRGRPTWDTVVFDMPASGHSMSMLRIPKVIVETVPEGPLTRDARSVMSLLRNDALTAAVLVTLAEEMPANEACELSEKLRSELEIKTAQLVINQVYPSGVVEAPTAKVLQAVLEAVKQAGVTADPVLRGLAAHGDLVAARRKLNVHYIAQLRAQIQAPTVELPMLFTPTLGPGEIQQLSELLAKNVSPT